MKRVFINYRLKFSIGLLKWLNKVYLLPSISGAGSGTHGCVRPILCNITKSFIHALLVFIDR